MFYSHTFLARKGPLGTVWFAAHLQNKLKKSHYIATDIPSTVERIMFPEVPLALRMSGHLLLGIVRIYSKKVQFLYEDCNAVWTSLRKAFASLDLNLPEDARQAPVQAITLPDTFDLDAMDLDVEFFIEGAYDHHLKSHEEITIIDYTNQIPIETEIYVSISFDEDVMYDSSHPVEIPPSNVEATEHGTQPATANVNDAITGPSSQIGEDNVLQDPGLFHQTDMPTHSGDSFTKVSIEKGRDAVHVSPGIPPMFSSPVQPPSLGTVRKNKDIVPLATEDEDNAGSGGQISPLQQSSGPRASFASLQEEPMNIFEGSVSFAIQPSPPPEKPKGRARKRKQLYDEEPVLKNKFMKKSLEDPSDLKRKRKNAPSSALGVWKLKNNLRKEQIFLEPSITGLCSDLCDIFNEDYMSSKLQRLEEACPDSGVASPGSAANAFPEPELAQLPAPSPAPETATVSSPPNRDAEFQTPHEIEGSTHFAANDDDNTIPLPIVTPLSKSDHATAPPSDTLHSTPPPAMEVGRRVFSTPDFSVPSTHDESQLGTADDYMMDQIGLEYTNLSDIPEPNTADAEDLWFLEQDNNTPTGSQATQGIDSLSIRTRALAQFLKRQSPITPISEDLFGDLSLNKLLQGKTRKLCARMFFETLVLKSNGLVDVQQEVPYDDIILKLTPEFSKAQI